MAVGAGRVGCSLSCFAKPQQHAQFQRHVCTYVHTAERSNQSSLLWPSGVDLGFGGVARGSARDADRGLSSNTGLFQTWEEAAHAGETSRRKRHARII